VEDVDTAAENVDGLPAGWPERSGLHLVTAMEYDLAGRTVTTVLPGGRIVKQAFSQVVKEKSGKLTTIKSVKLTAPQMSEAGDYSLAPISIECACSGCLEYLDAKGIPLTNLDGELTNDWDSTQEDLWCRTDELIRKSPIVQKIFLPKLVFGFAHLPH
jgi:YD repeat-containing protein